MVCPRRELSFGELSCDTPPAFVAVQYSLPDLWGILPDFIVEEVRPALWTFVPGAVRDTFAAVSWTCMPAQMHAVALAAFASIIGPFGASPPLAHPAAAGSSAGSPHLVPSSARGRLVLWSVSVGEPKHHRMMWFRFSCCHFPAHRGYHA